MMNHTYGWMDGWMGGGRMWICTAIGVLVVLLVVMIGKLSRKSLRPRWPGSANDDLESLTTKATR